MTRYSVGGKSEFASIEVSADLAGGVSVVVPVYNSEATLPLLIARLEGVLRGLTQHYEAILVNDGSRDGSWEAVKRLAQTHGWVRGFNLMRNFGQHNALLCGIRAARYAFIVTIDDDLQNPPEEIPKLLDELNRGFDVVYGPPEKEQHGLLRDLASVITKLVLQKTMGAATARKISAFRVFRTRLRQAFANYQSPYVSIDVLLTWGTAKFSSVSVRHDARASGISNYTLGKLLVHALNMFTGFSTWPLRLASVIGFAFTFFGVGVLAYVLGRYLLQGTTVAGFPFLASIIAIFSGAQLFALGLIGEYLARLHSRMMERPVYAVLEETSQAE
ncbi:MAG: glycosyltransferase family 2 protein [Acidobacteriia bacterium]|nr:glycosyltransferase family 2 protein [Terriglobia bacterium]